MRHDWQRWCVQTCMFTPCFYVAGALKTSYNLVLDLYSRLCTLTRHNAVYFVSSAGTPLDGATLMKEPWRDEMSDINNKDFLRSAYG